MTVTLVWPLPYLNSVSDPEPDSIRSMDPDPDSDRIRKQEGKNDLQKTEKS